MPWREPRVGFKSLDGGKKNIGVEFRLIRQAKDMITLTFFSPSSLCFVRRRLFNAERERESVRACLLYLYIYNLEKKNRGEERTKRKLTTALSLFLTHNVLPLSTSSFVRVAPFEKGEMFPSHWSSHACALFSPATIKSVCVCV